jgi:plastocyanin
MRPRFVFVVLLVVAVAGCGEAARGTPDPAPQVTAPPVTAPPVTAPPVTAPPTPETPAVPSPLSGVAVEIKAQSHAFDRATLTVPAGEAFHIVFTNEETVTPHNVEIEDTDGNELFFGKVFDGVETRTYDVPALAAGTYRFLCSVHPEMEGTLVAE